MRWFLQILYTLLARYQYIDGEKNIRFCLLFVQARVFQKSKSSPGQYHTPEWLPYRLQQAADRLRDRPDGVVGCERQVCRSALLLLWGKVEHTWCTWIMSEFKNRNVLPTPENNNSSSVAPHLSELTYYYRSSALPFYSPWVFCCCADVT